MDQSSNWLADLLRDLPPDAQPADLPPQAPYVLIGGEAPGSLPMALPRVLSLAEWLDRHPGPRDIVQGPPSAGPQPAPQHSRVRQQ